MAFIVCEPCIKCRYTECAGVCPVDCFRAGETMLVIDPEECIDCGVCVNECPVHAIYSEDEVPAKWRDYIELNARYSKEWPVVEETRDPLPTADEFKDIREKREHFSPNPAGDA